MADPRMTDELVELVADHLGCDADEVEFFSADMRPEEISRQWNECTRDLSHLDRETRRRLLQRDPSVNFSPQMVGNVAVHLFSDVQTTKGQSRVNVAIIDFGDRCQIASY